MVCLSICYFDQMLSVLFIWTQTCFSYKNMHLARLTRLAVRTMPKRRIQIYRGDQNIWWCFLLFDRFLWKTFGTSLGIFGKPVGFAARVEQIFANLPSAVYLWSSACMNGWYFHLFQVSIITSMLLVVRVAFLLEDQLYLQPMFLAVTSFIIMMSALLGVFIKVPKLFDVPHIIHSLGFLLHWT